MRRLLAVVFLLPGACRPRLPEVQKGSKVRMSYTMTEDGAPSESATVRFVSGSGELPAALDERLLGLRVGEEKTITLPPEKGFGLADPAKVQTLPIKKFGDQARLLKPGASVSGVAGGRLAEARVVRVESGQVVLDFNHPRAGKTLGFKVKILEILSP